uniref:UPAR/Ly6 domain-containing protein n=1 Tax=Pelusios castaneus TaxID=367368 RepID=A0A8C8SMK2_9SAUR
MAWEEFGDSKGAETQKARSHRCRCSPPPAFLRFQAVSKGCARRSRPDEAVELSSHLLALSYRAQHCEWDGCNAQSLLASESAPPNQLHCHACTSQGNWCPHSARTLLGCTGVQDKCLDLDITGTLGEFSNMKLKGCASLPRCQDGLGFYTGSRAIHARCCNTPLCNHLDTDFHVEAEPHNGLQCYSCVDEDGNGCTSNSTSTVPCMGHHNMCLEGIGRSRKGGASSVLVTFKGCATPAMCQSSLLALVQELDDAEVYCCTGSLCNTRIMDGHVAGGLPGHPSRVTGPTPEPDCILEEDEDVVIPIAGGHSNQETKTTESSEGHGWQDGGHFVAGGQAVPHTGGQGITLHPNHVVTGTRGTLSAEDDSNTGSRDVSGAREDFSESSATQSTGVSRPNPADTSGPATIILEESNRSEPSTNETSVNAKAIPVGAGLAHAEDEEECEEETNYSVSTGSTNGLHPDHSDGSTESPSHFKVTTALNAGAFVAEGDGLAGSPSHAGSTPAKSRDKVVAAEGAGHGATESPSVFAMRGSGTSDASKSHAGSARESFVAQDSATTSPDLSAVAHGSPGDRTDSVFPIISRQNESFFSEDMGVGSNPSSAVPVNSTDTVLAVGGAKVGSHQGKNKTLCTKRPGVAPVGHGLFSHDSPTEASHAAHAGPVETVGKSEGSLERKEGDRDWPTVSFPITVETPNSSLRNPLGNTSTPLLEEHMLKNASGWLYTPVIQGKPRPPYHNGAFGLSGNLSLVTFTLLLAVLLQ